MSGTGSLTCFITSICSVDAAMFQRSSEAQMLAVLQDLKALGVKIIVDREGRRSPRASCRAWRPCRATCGAGTWRCASE